MLLSELSRDREAIDAYSQAIKINPTASDYYMRSDAYCAVGDKQKAKADRNSAEKLGDNIAKALPVCGN